MERVGRMRGMKRDVLCAVGFGTGRVRLVRLRSLAWFQSSFRRGRARQSGWGADSSAAAPTKGNATAGSDLFKDFDSGQGEDRGKEKTWYAARL